MNKRKRESRQRKARGDLCWTGDSYRKGERSDSHGIGGEYSSLLLFILTMTAMDLLVALAHGLIVFVLKLLFQKLSLTQLCVVTGIINHFDLEEFNSMIKYTPSFSEVDLAVVFLPGALEMGGLPCAKQELAVFLNVEFVAV